TRTELARLEEQIMISKACLVAQGVTRDADTDTITIYNILEGVAAEGFPLFLGNLSLFCLLEKTADEPNEYSGTFSISLGRTELASQGVALNFQGHQRNRVIIRIPGAVLPNPGDLIFRLVVPDRFEVEYVA